MNRLTWRRDLTMMCACALTACSDPSGPGRSSAAQSVVVNATQTEIAIGSTVQLVATAVDANGGAVTGASITWTSSDPTVASVTTGGLVRGTGAGNTTIRAVVGTASGSVDIRVAPGVCAAANAGAIAMSQSLNGSLTVNDCVFPGWSSADGYSLTLGVATDVQIDLMSNDFDALLLITNAQMQIVGSDDDSGNGFNSRFIGSLPAGTYIVWATAFSGMGAYQLTMGVPPALCSSALAAGTIDFDQTRSGTLASTDCRFPDSGASADGYVFTMPEAGGVRLNLSSTEFFPRLHVTDLQMNLVGYSTGSESSSQFAGALGAGTYIAWASTDWNGQTGAYELTMTEASFCTPNAAIGTVEIGQTRSGTLSTTTCQLDSSGGGSAQGWAFTVPELSSVQITLAGLADAAIIVTDGQMFQITGSFADGTTAQVQHTFPAGTYYLWPTQFVPGGAYELSVQSVAAPACTLGSIQTGQSINGSLAAGDCTVFQTSYADFFELVLAEPATVQIDLMSATFDPLLVLNDDQGTIVTFDDDGGAGLNSRIIRTLAAGTYTVWTTSAYIGQVGAYQLSVQTVQGGAIVLGNPATGAVRSKPGVEDRVTSIRPPSRERSRPGIQNGAVPGTKAVRR